jgi:hypothetical protein
MNNEIDELTTPQKLLLISLLSAIIWAAFILIILEIVS